MKKYICVSCNYEGSRGFTLLEMLLVIAIIAILAAIVIVAINPGRQMAQARNAQRTADLNAIEKAVKQHYIDNRSWPPPEGEIPSVLTDICNTGGGETDGCMNLENALVPRYLAALPINPNGGNYQIALNNNQFALIAPGSKEYNLGGVAVGTSTDMISGGNDEDDNSQICGDITNSNCWSQVFGPSVWGASSDATGATSYSDGQYNTNLLVSISTAYEAATFCEDLVEDGYDDWYLPALNQLYPAINNQFLGDGSITGFSPDVFYWSSTEFPSTVSVWVSQYNVSGNYIYTTSSSKTIARLFRCLR